MRGVKRFAAALALVVAAIVAVGTTPAFADSLVIRKVDSSNFPTVVISAQVNGAAVNPADVHVQENGQPVNHVAAVPLRQTGTPVGIVLLVDTSASMSQNGRLDEAKAAVRQFVLAKQPNDQIALVSVASQPRVVVNFTADANALLGGIDSLVAAGETALWDGVRTSVGLFADHPDLQANVVVLTDGQDSVSTSTYNEAKAAAQTAHATVDAVGLDGAAFDGGPLQDLTTATQGQYQATADPNALPSLYAQVQHSLQNQYQITYKSTSDTGTLDLALTVGTTQATASVTAGGVTQGLSAQPQVVNPNGGRLGFLGGSTGKLLAVLLGLIAAGLLAYGITLIVVRERSTLETALRPYTGEDDEEGAEDFEPEHSAFADSAFMQRAVGLTARIAEERGILARVESMMEQADLPLRAAEALFFYAASVVVLTLLVGVLSRSIFATLAALIIAGIAPVALLQFLAGQRRRKFQTQLPDMLQLMAGSLRAGYSLMQGVEAVAQEIDDPMGRELRRVLAEARLGRVLEDSLEDMAERLGSRDFGWAVMAIRIQREVGGNLAELLSTVAETMIARERLRREVRALTAEGRISAIILGLLPVGLGAVMYSINRDYINVLLHDGFGQTLLIGAALLAGAGFYWMKKTIEIDI